MKNEKGFTLVEMLVVLLIISILILISVPNITKHFSSIDNKGCDAYIQMVQAQVEAYKIDHNIYPDDKELVSLNYLKADKEGNITCPDGTSVYINQETGEVTKGNKTTADTNNDESSNS